MKRISILTNLTNDPVTSFVARPASHPSIPEQQTNKKKEKNHNSAPTRHSVASLNSIFRIVLLSPLDRQPTRKRVLVSGYYLGALEKILGVYLGQVSRELCAWFTRRTGASTGPRLSYL